MAVDRDIETLIVGTNAEAILVARCRVTNNLEVAVIAICVITIVDISVAVQVNKLHVARSAHQLVVILEGHLVNGVRCVLHVCGASGTLIDNGGLLDLAILAIHEVALLIQAVGNITVDVAVTTTS